jgi:hypothetical protein
MSYIGMGDDSTDADSSSDSSVVPPVSVVLLGGLGILIGAYMLSGIDSKANITAAGKSPAKRKRKAKA